MIRFKKRASKTIYHLKWRKHKIKVHIYNENRKDSRVSITKTGVHIRLPILLPQFEKERLVNQFLQWATDQYDKRPTLYYNENKTYTDGDVLKLYDGTYKLHIIYVDSDKNIVEIKGNDIYLQISQLIDSEQQNKIVSKLLYKILAKKYKPVLWAWLNDLNNMYAFGDLNSMRMKNNSSNWGSCSSKGNINISIRLLLAPQDVVEYVLIHELSHLKEQNHSEAFWKIVENACPNYKKHEIWLKKHAKSCVI